MKSRILCAVLLLFSMTCAVGAQEAQINSPVKGLKHVVVIGIDGYGSAYVDWNEVPTLKRMKENGAWTLKTRCVLPSVSAINWATFFMGAGSELHGYRTWGSEKPDLPSRILTKQGKFPCYFSVAHDQIPNVKTGSVYTWKAIAALHDSERCTETVFIDHKYDESTAKMVEFQQKGMNLSYIYYSEPDCIGHGKGWGSKEYHDVVAQTDGYVGQIIKYLEENDRLKDTVVFFISDHGGIDKGHGHDTMTDMETPFIIYGCGVKPGEIEDVVVNYDLAPTIAWLLGCEAPQVWRGKPIKSAFVTE